MNCTAPIRWLPNEILTLIFEHICVGPATVQKILGDAPPVLQLSAVCSHWRSVLQSAPSLWTDIMLWFDADGNIPRFETVRLFLEQSKEKLLTLSIHFDHGGAIQLQKILDHPAFLAIASHAHRWEFLELTGQWPEDLCILRAPVISSCPELETLKLFEFDECDYGFVLGFVPMPKLTHLHGADFSPLHPTHSFPWHQLTRLGLDAIMHSVPRLVELCENLLDLDIHVDPRWEIHVPHLHISTTHPNLKCLCIKLRSSDPDDPETQILGQLLAALSFPSLTELEIINDSHESPNEKQAVVHCSFDMLEIFINKCSSTLEELALHDVSISDSDLTALLRNLPSLTSISIQDPHTTSAGTPIDVICPLSTAFINSLRVKTNPVLLPNLERISLVIRKEFDERTLIRMINSRWSIHDDSDDEDEDEDVEINFLYFAAVRIQLPGVDLEKLRPLKAMKEEGLEISVKTGMLDVVDFI
ncbi:hypothetical protein BT96DRAFT_10315 [Gymnopus androsaceus JB14]|uniref:F-box domain-containing protein n=1 Tax=Gymnopus androsaceus JB14 TaxID=1447944 RepID=A0A6A4IVB3_9AGAR|nr:hypothetical protein BT96DRAFT_10315 [Gymnopus androsaceus JB14]